mmetsp:Transcript_121354/g.223377  ORF Transcript_121354/g.223377 Transcript_121354/m.223377 type:complete len:496 (-) Transcript_121354:36-1523(-)
MAPEVSAPRCLHQAGVRLVRVSAATSVVLLAALLPRAAAAAAAAAATDGPGWVLSHHSFEKTLTYDDRLGDWLTSAATMPLRDRVQLLPPVTDRYALMWNKKAVSSKSFEISFTYRAVPYENQDGMFAFWIGSENFTASYDEQAIIAVKNWTQGLSSVGLTFFSNRPTFRGIGVIFLGVDRQGAPRPSITGVLCDGAKSLVETEFPASEEGKEGPMQTKFVDWRQSGVEMKVRIAKDSVIGSWRAPGTKEWVQLFQLPAEAVLRDMNDAYVGFSGYSGSESSLELDMSRLETRNFDAQHAGEQQDTLDEGSEEWLKVLEEEKRYIDQRSQKEAVEKLTKLLKDHVERYNTVGEQVKSELLWMEKRITGLEKDIDGFVTTLQAYNPDTGHVEATLVKEHIHHVKSVLTQHTDVHDAKLTEVHNVARQLKVKGADILGAEGRAKVETVANQAHALEQHASSGTLRTNSMLIVLVLAVAVLGLLFLNRMRYYEKKHYF